MPPFKNLSKVILGSLFLIVIFLLSEFAFTLNNNPNYSGIYHLLLAQKYASKDISKSLRYLENAAIKVTQSNFKESNHKLPVYDGFQYLQPEFTPQFQNQYSDLLSRSIPVKPTSPLELSKMFYRLGILAYQNGLKEVSKDLFRASGYIDPDVSYYHIELANLYLSEQNDNKASLTIKFCIQFSSPRKHCEEYLESNLSSSIPENVGFLQDLVLNLN